MLARDDDAGEVLALPATVVTPAEREAYRRAGVQRRCRQVGEMHAERRVDGRRVRNGVPFVAAPMVSHRRARRSGHRCNDATTVRSPHATELARTLRENGVSADSRRDVLRLGPAPYVSDEQLREAVAKLSRVVTVL